MASEPTVQITLELNGRTISETVPARENLADFIRHRIGLTGTNVGCEQGICGACTVRVNGKTTRSCLTLAAQVDGQQVETIEGITTSQEVADLQAAFHQNNAAQCGFCTPGMLMSAAELLNSGHSLDRQEIREFLSGNLCRCTGYQAIIDAVEQTGQARNG